MENIDGLLITRLGGRSGVPQTMRTALCGAALEDGAAIKRSGTRQSCGCARIVAQTVSNHIKNNGELLFDPTGCIGLKAVCARPFRNGNLCGKGKTKNQLICSRHEL